MSRFRWLDWFELVGVLTRAGDLIGIGTGEMEPELRRTRWSVEIPSPANPEVVLSTGLDIADEVALFVVPGICEGGRLLIRGLTDGATG